MNGALDEGEPIGLGRLTGWGGRAVLAVLLLYSAVHFAESGVRTPLSRSFIGQIEEEVAPLRRHLLDGRPVTTNNPRQYGTVFFFVTHPLLLVAANDPGGMEMGEALFPRDAGLVP